jgi:short-subunit dehydrogenase
MTVLSRGSRSTQTPPLWRVRLRLTLNLPRGPDMSSQRAPSWERALVTGASAGIGNAFARRLAADGTNLVLVARDQPRLEKLAEQLRREHKIDVDVLAADLSDDEQVSGVEERLRAKPRIDLLVNNAGFGTFGVFRDLPLDGELRQVDVNIRAVVRLAHAALATMTENGSGSIINMSSTLAIQPFPGSATYAATKAFVMSFSESLHEEARGTGVTVSAVMPGMVRTEFQERAGKAAEFENLPSFAWLSPDKVADSGLRAARRGKALSVPGFGYKVSAGMTSAAPRRMVRRMASMSSKRFR